MELREAIMGRRSIRGYLDRPVEKETIEEILRTAVRAVSANNTQPWEFVVVTGEKLDQMREINRKNYEEKAALDHEDASMDGIYLDRARVLGKMLFAEMGIERGDRPRRRAWGERGFRFFDAPALILLYMDRQLNETAYRLDMGCCIQNICLAAYDRGLGTCVEDQAVNYNRHYYEILDIPEDKRFVSGIAIGYPDPDFPANRVKSLREDIADITKWVGF